MTQGKTGKPTQEDREKLRLREKIRLRLQRTTPKKNALVSGWMFSEHGGVCRFEPMNVKEAKSKVLRSFELHVVEVVNVKSDDDNEDDGARIEHYYAETIDAAGALAASLGNNTNSVVAIRRATKEESDDYNAASAHFWRQMAPIPLTDTKRGQ